MSKELEYEVNNFANLLNKDCMNLMECLKKQGEDNKPILYLGKHYKKVILPYEEYQKMYKRLEAIDNANPSEALECLEDIYRNAVFISDYDVFGKQHTTNISPETNKSISVQCDIIKQALLKAQEPKQYVDELKLVEKKLKALEIIKKHFIIKLEEETELNGNIWGRLVSIQAKEDKDTWDTTASANIVDYKEEFDLLKEVLE